MRFKAWCSELVLWNAALVRYRMGWGIFVQYMGSPATSIASNLGSYWFVAVIPFYKANNGWGTRSADHTSPLKWLGDHSVCLQVDVKSAVGWQALALNGLFYWNYYYCYYYYYYYYYYQYYHHHYHHDFMTTSLVKRSACLITNQDVASSILGLFTNIDVVLLWS